MLQIRDGNIFFVEQNNRENKIFGRIERGKNFVFGDGDYIGVDGAAFDFDKSPLTVGRDGFNVAAAFVAAHVGGSVAQFALNFGNDVHCNLFDVFSSVGVERKIFSRQRFDSTARSNQGTTDDDGRHQGNFSAQRNFFEPVCQARRQFFSLFGAAFGIQFVFGFEFFGGFVQKFNFAQQTRLDCGFEFVE